MIVFPVLYADAIQPQNTKPATIQPMKCYNEVVTEVANKI